MHVPKLTAHMNTHIHKIPPRDPYTPLYPHKILHTKILPHTHLQKIRLMPIVHLCIIIKVYMQKYLRIIPSPTSENFLQTKTVTTYKLTKANQNLHKISGWDNVSNNSGAQR